MSFYFFQCVDVWLFRDGKLFDVGIGHRAQSMFPPYPTVIQGAIRSHQLALQHININDKTKIQEAVGDTENYQNLRLRGPFLSYKENEKITPYYPLPADAVTIDPESLSVRPSNQPIPMPEGTLTNSGDLWILGLGDQPSKGLGNLWLTQNDLISYLERKEVKGISEQNLFNRENRVGISIDPLSGTTRPGALFEVECQ
jgi:CRISPR-associated protein Cmr3